MTKKTICDFNNIRFQTVYRMFKEIAVNISANKNPEGQSIRVVEEDGSYTIEMQANNPDTGDQLEIIVNPHPEYSLHKVLLNDLDVTQDHVKRLNERLALADPIHASVNKIRKLVDSAPDDKREHYSFILSDIHEIAKARSGIDSEWVIINTAIRGCLSASMERYRDSLTPFSKEEKDSISALIAFTSGDSNQEFGFVSAPHIWECVFSTLESMVSGITSQQALQTQQAANKK